MTKNIFSQSIINKKILYSENNIADTQVIGFATNYLTNNKPESVLGNFISDAVKNEMEKQLRKRIDFVIISPNAIRENIPKGDITNSKIRNVLPFDDSLAYFEIDGNTLIAILNRVAAQGGAPISGIKMIIHNMQATQITIDNDSLALNSKYTGIMIERNLQGKENFPFLKTIPYKIFPLTLTNLIIEHIKKITQEGKPVNAFFGHRIRYQ